jgi:hypothetical protein
MHILSSLAKKQSGNVLITLHRAVKKMDGVRNKKLYTHSRKAVKPAAV